MLDGWETQSIDWHDLEKTGVDLTKEGMSYREGSHLAIFNYRSFEYALVTVTATA